jgi:hypothetical protein
VKRRFPAPWITDETDACFIVRDAGGQALACVYFEDEPGRRSAASLLTRNEAWRIAANIAPCCRRCCVVTARRDQLPSRTLEGTGRFHRADKLINLCSGNHWQWACD